LNLALEVEDNFAGLARAHQSTILTTKNSRIVPYGHGRVNTLLKRYSCAEIRIGSAIAVTFLLMLPGVLV